MGAGLWEVSQDEVCKKGHFGDVWVPCREGTVWVESRSGQRTCFRKPEGSLRVESDSFWSWRQ